MMNSPPEVLNNGATIVAYTEQHPGGSGLRRHGIALCAYEHNIGDWVTWRVIQREDGEWFAESGNYLRNANEAIADYRERLGIQKSTSSDLTS
jgi:hypothetical protein